jgi:hypothetical protein
MMHDAIYQASFINEQGEQKGGHLLQNRRGHCPKKFRNSCCSYWQRFVEDVDAQSTQHSRNHKFSNSDMHCNVDEEDAAFKKP